MALADGRRSVARAATRSSGLALASVTAVLKTLIENGLASRGVTSQLGGDATISALPPDRVPSGSDERAQLNIFLYLVSPHARLRIDDSRGSRPTLAVDLHYLITAYGAQDYQTEILLGHTIELLEEQSTLEREAIRTALDALSESADHRVVPPTTAALAASDLAEQIDRITIVPEFLGTEEMAKLWSALQARYRPSATYKVSAVPVASGKGAPR